MKYLNLCYMTKSLLETDIFNYHTPEFFINMKSVPDKTSSERGAFISEEKRKAREGININQVYIPGSLYFHLNFYKLEGDDKNNRGKKAVFLPTLRDNEWIVFNDYDIAQKAGKIYTLFGLRQSGKSEMEVSLCLRELSLYKHTEALALFANSEYRDNFTKKIRTAIHYGEKFIIIPNMDKDWGKNEIRFGLTKQDSTIDLRGVLYIYNMLEGKKVQVGSGKTPSFFLIDEAGASPFRSVYDTVEPALLTDYGGLRCAPMFTLTGGEAEKAKDAEALIKYPVEEKQFLTTMEDGKVVGGRFLDGRYRKDCKKPMQLSEYLGVKTNTWLDEYIIHASDFELGLSTIKKERDEAEKSPDRSTLLLKRVFFPLNLDDVFLSQSQNNFPISAAKAHQYKLNQGEECEYVELYRNENNQVRWKYSSLKPINIFPVTPESVKEAPVVIIEHPEDNVPHGTYCIGIDCYNKNESSDRINSLGTIYVLKRMVDPLGAHQHSIVAYYAGRPDDIIKFYQIAYNLTEYYNGIILPELNERFSDYFVNKKKGYLIQNAMQLAKDINQNSFAKGSEKGLSPTTRNQKYGMELCVGYTLEEVVGENGEISLGVIRIPDPMLLEEMIHYRSKSVASKGIHDGNFDRIVAFYHALILAEHLDKYMPIQYKGNKKEEPVTKKEYQINGFFGQIRAKQKEFKNFRPKPQGFGFI